MNNKLSRQGGNLTELIIIVLILAVVSFLGYRFFWRMDLTEKKQYTISKATKDVLHSLDDTVDVEVFMSRDLPPQVVTMASEVRNKLDEYARYGGGKIKVHYTDPGDDEKEKERAASLGVQELQLQVIDKGSQLTVKKIFFGLVMNFVDKSEPIPQIVDPTTLEYDITSRLVKFSMGEKPKIGFFKGPLVIGQQGQGNEPQYNALGQILGGTDGLYELVNIDPQTDKKLPDGLKAVIIAGAFGMSDTMKYSLDQFIMGGGQVLLMIDPMMETGGQMGGLGQAFPALPTIEDQLEKYGITLNKKLIADQACANASFRAGIFTLQQPYLLWPKIGPQGLNGEVGPIAPLTDLVVPWSCPLVAKDDLGGVKLTKLFETSGQAFLLDSPFDLDPQQDWKFKLTTSTEKGRFVVGYMATGTFKSAFDGSKDNFNVPSATDDSGAPLFNPANQLKEGNGAGRLIVVSSAKMISDDFMQQYPVNRLFAANMADMLALGDQLAGIRSAPVVARPLKTLNESQQQFIRWSLVLGLPLLLCLFGLLLWWLRNQGRKAIQARYAE